MKADHSPRWHLAIGLLVGVAVGAAGALFASHSGPIAQIPSSSESGSSEAAAALAQIAADIRSLRDSIAAEARAPRLGAETQREPAEAAATERLERAINGLTELLRDRGPLASGAGPVPKAIPVAGRPKDLGLLAGLRDADPLQRAKPYYLWRYEQVLERFGSPDSVGSTGDNQTVQVCYRLAEQEWVKFDFMDGVLVGIR